MKTIIDDFSPILEGVEVEELKEKVRRKPKLVENKSQEDSLLPLNTANGKDVPVGE
jgi:hypothetical protein